MTDDAPDDILISGLLAQPVEVDPEVRARHLGAAVSAWEAEAAIATTAHPDPDPDTLATPTDPIDPAPRAPVVPLGSRRRRPAAWVAAAAAVAVLVALGVRLTDRSHDASVTASADGAPTTARPNAARPGTAGGERVSTTTIAGPSADAAARAAAPSGVGTVEDLGRFTDAAQARAAALASLTAPTTTLPTDGASAANPAALPTAAGPRSPDGPVTTMAPTAGAGFGAASSTSSTSATCDPAAVRPGQVAVRTATATVGGVPARVLIYDAGPDAGPSRFSAVVVDARTCAVIG